MRSCVVEGKKEIVKQREKVYDGADCEEKAHTRTQIHTHTIHTRAQTHYAALYTKKIRQIFRKL